MTSCGFGSTSYDQVYYCEAMMAQSAKSPIPLRVYKKSGHLISAYNSYDTAYSCEIIEL